MYLVLIFLCNFPLEAVHYRTLFCLTTGEYSINVNLMKLIVRCYENLVNIKKMRLVCGHYLQVVTTEHLALPVTQWHTKRDADLDTFSWEGHKGNCYTLSRSFNWTATLTSGLIPDFLKLDLWQSVLLGRCPLKEQLCFTYYGFPLHDLW